MYEVLDDTAAQVLLGVESGDSKTQDISSMMLGFRSPMTAFETQLVNSLQQVLAAFQNLVDTVQGTSTSTLILCGSSISVMESDVMGHESPLYGRRTAQIDLQPFTFAEANEIIDYPFEERIRSFAVTGGMPMYLTLFDYDESLEMNLLHNHLSKTSIFYDEPEFLLRTELRNPSRYMSILKVIANGYTTPNEIAGQTDIGSGPLLGYLQPLRRLRLVQREVPVTAIEKKSKRSVYEISDEFLRFWFRFVEPNRSGIEQAPELVLEDLIVSYLTVLLHRPSKTSARRHSGTSPKLAN